MSGIGLRIKAVRAERKVSLEWVAERVGVRYQTIQDLENGTSQGSKHLLKIARALGVQPNWLETGTGPKDIESSNERETSGAKPTAPQALPANEQPELLEVRGMAEGGPDGWSPWNGEVIQYIRRPDNLIGVPGAYAVYVMGGSMAPRYHQGELVHIHPGKPVTPGAYILIQKKPAAEGEPPLAVIKRLVRRSGSKIVVAQHTPAKEFEIKAGEVLSLHRVVGSSEA
jgi:phage repressor protein C with HTH and peptisase S24 domain